MNDFTGQMLAGNPVILHAMQPCAILDFPDPSGLRQPLAFYSPRETLIAESAEQVRGVIRRAESYAQNGAWVVGFVSYEAAPAFDSRFAVQRVNGDFPFAWFSVFDTAKPYMPEAPDHTTCATWSPDVERETYESDIAAIRHAIHEGEVYQVNHTLRLHSSCQGSGISLFNDLRNAQPRSYAAYLDLGRWKVLSVSPELFFRLEKDAIATRPMKGTIRRGRFPAEDMIMAEKLRSSEKDRAENLMIVDLIRNDLSRIALPNSVKVQELFSVETHPTVHQMTSTVTARTRSGIRLDDVFAALFPCGSVTGAPKMKAMEIIARLEKTPRDIYCGAIGLLQPGGNATFNVAIRTVLLDETDRTATCGVGGGIVWDSTHEGEFSEAVLKSKFLAGKEEEFSLIETMRLEEGNYARLDYHVARLAASARYFNRPFDDGQCIARLQEFAENCGKSAHRIRMTLDSAGRFGIESSALPENPPFHPRFALSEFPVSRDNIWLFHKTTKRELYEHAIASFPDAFDVLLWNEQGELTEFTKGNIVLDVDGLHLTPPIECGLLDGCLRREMIDHGEITEARLTLADLERAEHIWFINSLRGRIEVFRS